MKTNSQTCLKLVVLFFVLHCCIFIAPTAEYSLRNCTVSGSLNDTDMLKVLCYKMNFTRVPSPLPQNATILVVSFNLIVQIRVGDFSNLTNLRELNGSNNQISDVQAGAFKNLAKLEELNLAQNKLDRVSRGLLEGLSSLSILRLDRNYIEIIEHSAFISLLNLKVVNFTKNKFQHIERLKPMFKSPVLEELYIGRNNFSAFHSKDLSLRTSLWVKKLDLSWNPLMMFQMTEDIFPHLDFLDLSYCGKKGILDWTIQDRAYLNSVKTLNLSGIHVSQEGMAAILQSFNASLNKLKINYVKGMKMDTLLQDACSPELRVLNLKSNNLSSLTDHVFNPCSLLTELNLVENGISHMSPLTFNGLTQLKILKLQINKLTQVNSSLQVLPTLEVIDLSRNKINQLTCFDFANLTQLRILYLYSNQIAKISACLFKDLQNLQELILGTNMLLSVTDTFRNGPISLNYLELRRNKLSSIKKGTFERLHSLQWLDLGDNQISEIEGKAFKGLGNLTCVLLQSNKIKEKTIRNPLVFSDMPKLQHLDLHSNYISYTNHDELKESPFKHLKSLKILAINSQRHGFDQLPSNLLQGLTSLEMFYAGNLNINYLHPDTFNHTPNLWFLDLTKNVFTGETLSPGVFHPIPRLIKLIISRNPLQSLDFLLKANLSRLSVLRASGNELAVINQTLIQSLPRLKYLDLQNNTFTCDCSNAWFINWAMKDNHTQVVYLSRYTCSYPSALRGMNLADLNTESCTLSIDFMCFLSSSSLVILTLLISLVYHSLRWQVVYAYYLFLAFLYDSKRKQTHQQHGFQYDAFISYNTQDEPWVLEELLPKLEGEQGWRLCLHQRDFQPGKPIIDNIVDGIYSSRKTICLITLNYLQSHWCSREIQVASFRLFDEQKDVLILVFLEDIPTYQLSPYHRMRKLVKSRTYLSWPKPGEDTRVFWQKLRMAMETKENPKQENPILSGQENEILDRDRIGSFI